MTDNWKEYYELHYDYSFEEKIRDHGGWNGLPSISAKLCPLTGEVVSVNIKKLDCECGMNSVYGKDNTIHSDWCQLNKK